LASFIGYKAYQIYSGNAIFPTKCTGRGSLFCELADFIFAQFGLPAVFMATFAISLLLFVAAYFSLTPEKVVDYTSEKNNISRNVVSSVKKPQILNDVLEKGEEPTEAFLEEFSALENAEPIAQDELEKQAMKATKVAD
jgi:hypothetical protein